MLTRLLDRLALLPDRTHMPILYGAFCPPCRAHGAKNHPSRPHAAKERAYLCIDACSCRRPRRFPTENHPQPYRAQQPCALRSPPQVPPQFSFVSVSVHIQTSAPSPEATRYAPHYSKPFRPQTARLGPKQPALHSHCGIVRMESCAPDTDAGTSAVVSREQPCHRFFDPVVLLASVVDLSLSTPSQVTFPKTPAASGYCPRSGTSYPDRLGSSVPTMTTSSSPRRILSCNQSFKMPLLPRPAPLLHAAREAAGE
jgi:hypothetical protein